MTRQRFHQVLIGARGEAAKNKFLDHLRGEGQGQGIGTKGNRPPQTTLYITPFALPLPTTVLIQCSALQPSYQVFSGFSSYSSRVKTDLPDASTSIQTRSYAPARIIRRQQNSTTGAVKESKLTGLKYLKYSTTTNSAPFGKKTGDTSVFDVFEEIAAQVKGSATNLKFSFLEERV